MKPDHEKATTIARDWVDTEHWNNAEHVVANAYLAIKSQLERLQAGVRKSWRDLEELAKFEVQAFDRAMEERAALLREIETSRAEVSRLQTALNRDQTGLAAALNRVRTIVSGWGWIARREWGSYPHEERTVETLQTEVRHLIAEAVTECDRALRASGELARVVLSADDSLRSPFRTVREACRQREPLDGSDAQALEHALTITERERDNAVSAAKHNLAICHKLQADLSEARRLAEAWRKWAGLVGWATSGEPEPFEFPWETPPAGKADDQ